jgi:hypothetical protein
MILFIRFIKSPFKTSKRIIGKIKFRRLLFKSFRKQAKIAYEKELEQYKIRHKRKELTKSEIRAIENKYKNIVFKTGHHRKIENIIFAVVEPPRPLLTNSIMAQHDNGMLFHMSLLRYIKTYGNYPYPRKVLIEKYKSKNYVISLQFPSLDLIPDSYFYY